MEILQYYKEALDIDPVEIEVQAVANPIFVEAGESNEANKEEYESQVEENQKEAEDTVPESEMPEPKYTELDEALFEDITEKNIFEFPKGTKFKVVKDLPFDTAYDFLQNFGNSDDPDDDYTFNKYSVDVVTDGDMEVVIIPEGSIVKYISGGTWGSKITVNDGDELEIVEDEEFIPEYFQPIDNNNKETSNSGSHLNNELQSVLSKYSDEQEAYEACMEVLSKLFN